MKKLLSILLLTFILSIPFQTQASPNDQKTFQESFIITHISNGQYYGKSLETDACIYFTIDDISNEKDYPKYSLIIATINEYDEIEYIEKAIVKDNKLVPVK